MSKGRDFRGPRKRGFDDDAPYSYDSPRTSRAPRSPFGGGFPDSPPPMSNEPAVDAIVKWFKTDKGFGFVELANGTGDAFLHIGAVQAAGYDTLPPGAKLQVQVTSSVKGQQVARILEVDLAGAAERAPPPPPRAGGGFDSPGPVVRRPIRRLPFRSPARSNGSTRQKASALCSRTTAARTCSSIFRFWAHPA